MTASRERTPEDAMWLLGILRQTFLVVGIVYLALHAWVSGAAYVAAGVLAAIVTFITLGFGDFYWAFTGLGDPAVHRADWYVAVAATAMAFLSWGMRPWTNAFLMRLGADAMRDAFDEVRPVSDHASAAHAPERTGAAADDHRPGGAA
jgi:hypothetical protein